MGSAREVFEPVGDAHSELCHPRDHRDFDLFGRLLDGTPRASTWRPPQMELIRDNEGKPLLYSDSPWLGSWSLLFRARAVDALGSLLTGSGELLPLGGVPDVFAFNPFAVLDALDEAASTVNRFSGDGRVFLIRRHVFRPEVVGDHVAFKLTALRVSPTYVTQPFVDAWRRAALVGLDFTSMWSQA